MTITQTKTIKTEEDAEPQVVISVKVSAILLDDLDIRSEIAAELGRAVERTVNEYEGEAKLITPEETQPQGIPPEVAPEEE